MEDVACTHRPPCPGCPRYGEAGVADPALAALRALAQQTGARLEPVEEGAPLGHRHRARLMVRGRARSPKIGLFQQGTHRIVDTPHCRVHHPAINRAAAALRRAIRGTAAEPYADAPHRGLVRALQVVVERRSGRVQAAVVANESEPGASQALLDAFAAELEAEGLLQGVWWNGNPGRTNVIVGPHWIRHRGEAWVRESIGGAEVFFGPGAFGQSHLALADRAVARIHRALADVGRIAEWYAGCGAIGLGLLARGAQVAFNESSPHGLAGLERGIEELGAAAAARVRVVPGSAGAATGLVDACDAAVVDPPRRGLDEPLRAALASAPPERLVYLSCGLESLLTDARALLEGGRLRLASLTPFAFFPYTEHVETLALFERRRSSPRDPSRSTLAR